jgi:hypothetical protein
VYIVVKKLKLSIPALNLDLTKFGVVDTVLRANQSLVRLKALIIALYGSLEAVLATFPHSDAINYS